MTLLEFKKNQLHFIFSYSTFNALLTCPILIFFKHKWKYIYLHFSIIFLVFRIFPEIQIKSFRKHILFIYVPAILKDYYYFDFIIEKKDKHIVILLQSFPYLLIYLWLWYFMILVPISLTNLYPNQINKIASAILLWSSWEISTTCCRALEDSARSKPYSSMPTSN